ncbi:hypothetical protein HYPSUDRAFT_199151 [Hypholoma sublateritium FD-334 SS-4]|uniref:Uncharacterized protein n=1 Tax=Hypholoma sublateritium (strain FD-334 SS-4) TaxID=945553 RepID=A0A0D2MR01_HYPSF|nr:hypothetical protein HYPSUDRAFT_199151 [Hypholoma sublateritium FD-334 SS-4]
MQIMMRTRRAAARGRARWMRRALVRVRACPCDGLRRHKAQSRPAPGQTPAEWKLGAHPPAHDPVTLLCTYARSAHIPIAMAYLIAIAISAGVRAGLDAAAEAEAEVNASADGDRPAFIAITIAPRDPSLHGRTSMRVLVLVAWRRGEPPRGGEARCERRADSERRRICAGILP